MSAPDHPPEPGKDPAPPATPPPAAGSAPSRPEPAPAKKNPLVAPTESETRSPWRRVIGGIIGICVLLAAVVLSLLVWDIMEHHPRTDDAYLQANVVAVAPRVKGQIIRINVVDNQAVNVGDVLFEIDPADYETALAKARSSLAALDQEIEIAKAQNTNLQYQIKAAIANVNRAEFELKQANDTLHRMEPLLPKGFASANDVDKARTARDAASATLGAQQQQLEQARTTLSTLESLVAQRPGQEANVRQAELDLSYCKVTAVVPGRVVSLNTSPGTYVNAGTALFTMVDSSHWYVIADFREGELRYIQPGGLVDVYLLADPYHHYVGRVQGIGYGVKPTESQTDTPGQLPTVQRELDWVHIAQRFPVRVEIDHPDRTHFRLGASAVATIR